MPKNKVSDPITDQEIAFARLVLSGTMTDRHAAEAVGLNPDAAAYTKSKPHVRAYMLEHRAAVEKQLVQQEVDLSRHAVEQQHRLKFDREKVLDRLWEIANLSSEMTRGSVTGQVKALSMIIAMQNFIPDPRAVDRLAFSSQKNFAPAPNPQIYGAACPATTIDPQPNSAQTQPAEESAVHEPAPTPAADPPPQPAPSQSTFANGSTPSQARTPHALLLTSVPDLGVSFSKDIDPFDDHR